MHRPHFLVIDDDPTILELLQIVLSMDNQVTAVRSVENALVAAEHGDFDAVIADMHMPGATGVELLTMIRAGETGLPRDIPFAILTANDRSVLPAGLPADAILHKPFHPSTLVDQVSLLPRRSNLLSRPA